MIEIMKFLFHESVTTSKYKRLFPTTRVFVFNNFYLIDARSVSAFFLYRISFSINGLIFCYYIR